MHGKKLPCSVVPDEVITTPLPNGLSSGQVAGIAVGTALVFGMVVVILVVLKLRRNWHLKKKEPRYAM